MKSERRHELQTNQLADWLASVIEKTKSYQNAILGLVLLMVVAGVALGWWARKSAATKKDGWNRFFATLTRRSLDPQEFEDIIEAYPGTDVAYWAGTMAGDLRLALGCNALFINKAAANQQLRGWSDQPGALDHYQKVLDESRHPMLLQRATFGLARAHEALGDLELAEEHYQNVVQTWPQGTYAAAAARRLEDLGKASTKQLYDKFADFTPTPYSSEPKEPGERFDFDNWDTLPDDGPLITPGAVPKLEPTGPEDKRAEDEQPQGPPDTSTDADAATPDATPTDTSQPEPAKPEAAESEPNKPESTEPAPD